MYFGKEAFASIYFAQKYRGQRRQPPQVFAFADAKSIWCGVRTKQIRNMMCSTPSSVFTLCDVLMIPLCFSCAAVCIKNALQRCFTSLPIFLSSWQTDQRLRLVEKFRKIYFVVMRQLIHNNESIEPMLSILTECWSDNKSLD